MAEQVRLNQLRGKIKAKMTRFQNFVQNCEDTQEKIMELTARIDKFEKILDDFDEVQTQIEELDDGDQQEMQRQAFEDSFYALLTRAKGLVNQVYNRMGNQNVNAPDRVNAAPNLNVPVNAVKLPIIEIPKFGGDWESWMPFHDIFDSLIHKNNSLSGVQKLHYLRSALVGSAALLIQSIGLTENNYIVAWDLIKGRYDSRKAIVQHHVQALLNIPTVSKESHSALQQLYDSVQQHLKTLEKLEQPINHWDTLLISILLPKLDNATKREWESERADKNELPTMKNFEDFLKTRCSFLEALSRTKTGVASRGDFGSSKILNSKNANASHSYVTTEKRSCPICDARHKIFECSRFRSLSVKERFERAKSLNLCFNCLRIFHGSNCRSGNCKKCGKSHNTLLHYEKREEGSNEIHGKNSLIGSNTDALASTIRRVEAGDTERVEGSSQSDAICFTSREDSRVLLATAIILVSDRDGKMHKCRALLDSASQANFITVRCSNLLKLERNEMRTSIRGIGQKTAVSSYKVETIIKSMVHNYNVRLTFLTIDQITDCIPATKIDPSTLRIPENICLADPDFNTPAKVDMILGASIFWDLILEGQIKLADGEPMLQNTKLGWIVSRSIGRKHKNQKEVECYFSQGVSLRDRLERFWKLEEIQTRQHYTSEERICEEHFLKTHKRDSMGRFVVELPLKENYMELGDSKEIATKRFLAMERKLNKNPDLKRQYHEFIREYIELDHAARVTNERRSTDSSEYPEYYLPHHAVLKMESITTKLRVVFDASCKSTSGLSLNDVLLIGPTLQQDLFNIIIRFRQHAYVISADISKMYRQVLVKREQCTMQRILWRWSPTDDIETYELKTVTYGEAGSSYLAIKALQQAAIDLEEQFPEAGRVILRDFYVDDLLTGGQNADEVIRLQRDVERVLKSAQFELRKWKANSPEVISSLSNEDSTYLGQGSKILGLLWNCQEDQLQFEIKFTKSNIRPTKRQVLSSIAQIYDPLGLIGPLLIPAKIIMQELWKSDLSWNDLLPASISNLWINWWNQIQRVNQLKISRHVICKDFNFVEIHGFCDASELAYGACIYMRSRNDNMNEYQTTLLCSKSRVAPLKRTTLPRLELCSCVLLSKLCEQVLNSLSIKVNGIHLWNDSKVALAWIAGEPNRWTTFVANRVAEVQNLTANAQWHHIAFEENPADVLSRGSNVDLLLKHDIWWSGPTFLKHEFRIDPIDTDLIQESLPETRRCHV